MLTYSLFQLPKNIFVNMYCHNFGHPLIVGIIRIIGSDGHNHDPNG